MKFVLPDAVLALLARLRDASFSAYVVGGAVRDLVRGAPVHDYDLATNASPDEMRALFSDLPVIPTGIRHGTVTVLSDGMPVEITTFRTEAGYSDFRRPDRVRFVDSIEEDLSRRDFTINAMAYAPQEGLIDPYGGRADMKARRLACVGDAHTRFTEDALRVLRALRFASVLGFTLEKQSEAALFDCAPLLKNVASERLFAELYPLLCGAAVERVLLDYPAVLGELIPEILPCVGAAQNTPYHCYDVYTHTAKTVAACPPKTALRLAALFHDLGKPASLFTDETGCAHFHGHALISESIAKKRLSRLRAPRALSEKVVFLVRYHDRRVEPTARAVRRFLSRFGMENAREILLLQRADACAHAPDTKAKSLADLAEIETLMQSCERENPCLSLRSLAVNGDDLLALGFQPNAALGAALRTLLELVVQGDLPNDREALLSAAQKILKA